MADPITALATIIDFSVKVLFNAGKLMRAKAGEDDPETLLRLTKQYTGLADQVQNAQQRPLTADEASVGQLAEQCQDVSSELIHLLEGLTVEDTPSKARKAAKAIKSAGKMVWKRKEIEQKQKRLQELNGLLGTAMLDVLKTTQMTFQDDLFDQMNQDTQAILAAVRAATGAVTTEANRQVAKGARIANSLKFRDMLRRRDDVVNCYASTAEWVFDRDQHLRSWLQEGKGIFWIAGKAGSGKSTLMKHLCSHATTQKLCQQWAGDDCHLVRAEFFFWYLGSAMQRSVAGLLQSILYQILAGCPDLVRRVCPARWSCADNDIGETYPWSEDELEDALKKVSQEKCRAFVGTGLDRQEVPVRFVFFIDGLDEYAGNHRELTELLLALASSDHMKLCVSSRPWNPFSNAFELDKQYLRLEDHTSNDIALYVTGQLSQAEKKHRHHRIATAGATKESGLLASTIIEKANGVFFWVFLVVRSLQDGFSNGDNIQLMRKRVEELPSELEEYFALILQRLDPTYKRLAAQTLHLAMLAASSHPPGTLTAAPDTAWISFLDLWPLHERPDYFEHADFHVRAEIQEYTSPEVSDILLQVTRMVRAWCRDFIHIPASFAIQEAKRDGDLLDSAKIQFLHRTVYDFLVTDSVQEMMRKHVPEHMYHDVFVTELAIANVKLVLASERSKVSHRFWVLFNKAGAPAGCVQDYSERRLEALAEFDRLGAQFYHDYGSSEDVPRYCKIVYGVSGVRNLMQLPLSHLDLNGPLVRFRCYSLATALLVGKSKELRSPRSVTKNSWPGMSNGTGRTPPTHPPPPSTSDSLFFAPTKWQLATMLIAAIVKTDWLSGNPARATHPRLNMAVVRKALAAGANVDIAVAPDCYANARRMTCWQAFLEHCVLRLSAEPDPDENVWPMAKMFLAYGADPEVRVEVEQLGEQRVLSLFEALRGMAPVKVENNEIRELIREHSSIHARALVLQRREELESKGMHAGMNDASMD
ncbi:hypothetical protein LTR86_006886 [Recurvomyces mirabilis]|nr:hypothetical protein LTR86_006886 [Recurvomyces mirabilis]